MARGAINCFGDFSPLSRWSGEQKWENGTWFEKKQPLPNSQQIDVKEPPPNTEVGKFMRPHIRAGLARFTNADLSPLGNCHPDNLLPILAGRPVPRTLQGGGVRLKKKSTKMHKMHLRNPCGSSPLGKFQHTGPQHWGPDNLPQ